MSRTTVFFLAVLLPQLVLAHHGGAEYDLGKTGEIKAKLTRVELINPHAWIYFDVTETDGKVSHHRCEMRSVHVLRRSGWTKSCFRLASRSPSRLRRTVRIPPHATCKPSWRRMEPAWTAMDNTSRR